MKKLVYILLLLLVASYIFSFIVSNEGIISTIFGVIFVLDFVTLFNLLFWYRKEFSDYLHKKSLSVPILKHIIKISEHPIIFKDKPKE